MSKEIQQWHAHPDKVLRLAEILNDPILHEALNIVKLQMPGIIPTANGQDVLVAQTMRMSYLEGMRNALDLLHLLANPPPPPPDPEISEDWNEEWVSKLTREN